MYRLAACSLPACFSMRSRDWETYTAPPWFRDGGGCSHMALSCPALKLNEICSYTPYPNAIYVIVIDAATSVTLMQCSPPFHLKHRVFLSVDLTRGLKLSKEAQPLMAG